MQRSPNVNCLFGCLELLEPFRLWLDCVHAEWKVRGFGLLLWLSMHALFELLNLFYFRVMSLRLEELKSAVVAVVAEMLFLVCVEVYSALW